jgi:hypothetical protein
MGRKALEASSEDFLSEISATLAGCGLYMEAGVSEARRPALSSVHLGHKGSSVSRLHALVI